MLIWVGDGGVIFQYMRHTWVLQASGELHEIMQW